MVGLMLSLALTMGAFAGLVVGVNLRWRRFCTKHDPVVPPSAQIRMRGRCTRCLETVDVSHAEVKFGREV